MTIVATFLCTDGVVVAADSMITSLAGNIPIAHHTEKKISILSGNQIFASSGDQGLSERFRVIVDRAHGNVQKTDHPIYYPVLLTQSVNDQFRKTGISGAINLEAVLAYDHKNKHYCCVFDAPLLQPRLLNKESFYASLGSGMLSAEPFLHFLVDIFCQDGPPNVSEGVFLATWVVEHVIRTNPGGVAGPTRIGILERNQQDNLAARELHDSEIDEHRQAIESARTSLKDWRDKFQTGAEEDKISPPPKLETK